MQRYFWAICFRRSKRSALLRHQPITCQHYWPISDSLQFLFPSTAHNLRPHYARLYSFFVTPSHLMLSAMPKTSVTIIWTYHKHMTHRFIPNALMKDTAPILLSALNTHFRFRYFRIRIALLNWPPLIVCYKYSLHPRCRSLGIFCLQF